MATQHRIEVTQDDIDKSKRGDGSLCIVATALARQIPDAVRVLVDTQTIRFTHAETGERVQYLTPYIVQQYVIAFDAGDRATPFAFKLNSTERVRIQRKKPKPTPPKKHAPKRARPRGGDVPTEPAYDDPTPTPKPTPPALNEKPRKAAPYAFRRKRRDYGMRALRINQARGINSAAVPIPDDEK